jgi:hypothetical protein
MNFRAGKLYDIGSLVGVDLDDDEERKSWTEKIFRREDAETQRVLQAFLYEFRVLRGEDC